MIAHQELAFLKRSCIIPKRLEFTPDFKDTFQERGFGLLVPPTAVTELVYLSNQGGQKAQLARTALASMLGWGISPWQMTSVGDDITESFSSRLQDHGLLPPEELNDGIILAECGLRGVPLLATSDRHLLDIDHRDLAVQFENTDLQNVTHSSVCVLCPGMSLESLAARPTGGLTLWRGAV